MILLASRRNTGTPVGLNVCFDVLIAMHLNSVGLPFLGFVVRRVLRCVSTACHSAALTVFEWQQRLVLVIVMFDMCSARLRITNP